MKKIVGMFFFSVCLSWLTVDVHGALHPERLTCEYLVNPLGIDATNPRFAWSLNSSERNQSQVAYELLVSDNLGDLNKGEGNIWSPGLVRSAATTHIAYDGEPLRSFTKYFWKVRVHDQDGNVSAWTSPASFETAMLKEDDWKANWINDGSRQFDRDEDFYKDDRMPLFRKEILVKKKVLTARLYVSGLGYFEAYLNGKKVGDHVLDPGWTTHKKEVLYVVHDITPLVKTGKNVAGIMLGNGWWNPLPLRLFGRFNLRDFQQTDRPCVKAQIHLKYTDGSEEIIGTDQSWQTAPGPVIRNSVYLGEHYDARLEQSQWSSPGAILKAWTTASIAKGPTGTLHAQMQPPVRVTKIVKPVRISTPQPGVFIVDMGQNFAGTARIKVSGPSGTKISMRFGEALHDDGTLNFLTTVAGQIKEMWHLNGGPGAPATAWQEDSYTLKGKGVETWNSRFTFHGFRFIEIKGWPGKLTLNDIEGLRMNSDIQSVGSFACSNDMFNKLHETIQWTFLSNVFSVQSDCPGREKMGYGADMVTTANAYLYNYDMSNFYRKAVGDFGNEQQTDGGITEIAPYT
ncbi:MAG TPA: family 78 glycoside hydrolase catalytic domain, partial [Chryseolinea sp.]|nr:family 78 glycoside hydrolase catalytic domain [Chryseolinea sp.]